MTRIAAVAALLALPLLVATPAAADDNPAPEAASFYCVVTTPIYYQGQQVWAGSQYCVPGP